MNAAPTRTLLAFDYGERRIGIAVGTCLTATSHPVTTLGNAPSSGVDWLAISRIIETWEPDALVVGLPRHEDGSEHHISELARGFARQLEGRFRLPVTLVDEHLSSWQAREDLRQQRRSGQRRRRVRREDIDALAAQHILQSYFEEHQQ